MFVVIQSLLTGLSEPELVMWIAEQIVTLDGSEELVSGQESTVE